MACAMRLSDTVFSAVSSQFTRTPGSSCRRAALYSPPHEAAQTPPRQIAHQRPSPTEPDLIRQLLLLACIAVVLTACAGDPSSRFIPAADVLYRDAHTSLESGNYLRAETKLKQIMAHYPFTEFSVQAHLDLLFVLLNLHHPEELSEEADRFIRENPRHPEIDYAYYMKG